jgi:hypothetical protein
MFRLGPTAASGLSWATYGTELPYGDGFNLAAPRKMGTSTALDGTGIVSAWPKSLTASEWTTTMRLTDTQNSKLKLMDEHSTVTEWALSCIGRVFTVVIDVVSRTAEPRSSPYPWLVQCRFIVVTEITST